MTTMHHAGICVSDMAASLRFYCEGLELAVLADKVLDADLEALLGVRTESLRTVFLGDAEHTDSGIIELLELGVAGIADGAPQAGRPVRGVFLLSLQVDVPAALSRLGEMGLGGTPRAMTVPGGGIAATVTDPDGVMVELLPRGELAVMKSR
jgi:catechol 2,3-dioxygenase-like lactoylglutathione lyase family enzyme